MNIYERMRYLRIENGLTQREVAQFLQVRQSTYSQYESAHRQISVDVLKKLARYYDVTTDYLLGISDSPFTSR